MTSPLPPPSAPTLIEWCGSFLKFRTDLAQSSRRLYANTIAFLLACYGAHRGLDTISRDEAAGFRTWLEERGARRGTSSGHAKRAKVIFRAAADRDLIAFSPFDRVNVASPRVSFTLPDMDDDRMERLFVVCRKPCWVALFALSRWAGLRRGEAIRLRWADVNWARRELRIVVPVADDGAAYDSTKIHARVLPIRPRLFDLLASQYGNSKTGGPCDGLPRTGKNIWVGAVRRLRWAGHPKYAKPLHALRKLCATEWFDEHPPLTAAAWLGHTPAVAAQFYVKPTRDAIDAVTSGRRRAEGGIGAVLAKLEALEARLPPLRATA